MGCFLLPILIFWLVAGIYSLKLGYNLIISSLLFPDLLCVFILTILLFITYVYLGFNRFKAKKRLPWVEIYLFFGLNKIAFLGFFAGIILCWFGSSYLSGVLRYIPFILTSSLSFGSIVGILYSNKFMAKHQIKIIY